MNKIDIQIYIVLIMLVIGVVSVTGTKNDIKELLELDKVISTHNSLADKGLFYDKTDYINKETFAKVQLLQMKLSTELGALFFGFLVLLDLITKKGFTLTGAYKEWKKQ